MSKPRQPKLNSRALHKARYDGVGDRQLITDAYVAIVTFLRDARLSEDQKRASLQLALDEVEDVMAEQGPSWAEDVATNWRPAGKGRTEEID